MNRLIRMGLKAIALVFFLSLALAGLLFVRSPINCSESPDFKLLGTLADCQAVNRVPEADARAVANNIAVH